MLNILNILVDTNEEPKETYYAITLIKYYALTRRPLVKIDGHFSLLEEEKPFGMEHKLKVLTGDNTRNFYVGLEEIIATIEQENNESSKHTFLKRIVKNPYYLSFGPFVEICEDNKFTCSVHELKGEDELRKINVAELVNKSFEGSCIVKVYDSYGKSGKTIILFEEKMLVTGPTFPRKDVYDSSLEEESSSEESEGESLPE